ncbi:hypothetical protein TNCV_2951321 [Trichonephila clavipes]|nr:hypothetical protein TNCV_2951321 [Trichonephila clavipes]
MLRHIKNYTEEEAHQQLGINEWSTALDKLDAFISILHVQGNVQDEDSTTVDLTEGCQVNASQVNTGELNDAQVNADQINAGQVNAGQISASQANAGQVNGCQDTAMQEKNRETPNIRQAQTPVCGTLESMDSNLNLSTVTSVDMTFSTEPCASSPVVSGLSSMSTDSPSSSNTHQLPIRNMPGIDGILRSTFVDEIRAFVTGNSNDENLLNPSISGSSSGGSQIPTAEKNGENNPVGMDEIHTENSNASTEKISDPLELEDDDVLIIDPPPKDSQEKPQTFYDPSVLVPFILEDQPQFKFLYEQAVYLLHGLFVRFWAHFEKFPAAPDRISKAICNWKKYEALYRKSGKEKEQLQVQLEKVKEDNNKIQEVLERLKTQNFELKQEIDRLKHLCKTLKEVIEHMKKCMSELEDKWKNKYFHRGKFLEKTKKEMDLLKAENEKFRANHLSDMEERDLLKAENEKFQEKHLSDMKEIDLLKAENEKFQAKHLSDMKERDLLKAENEKFQAKHLSDMKERDSLKAENEKFRAKHLSDMKERYSLKAENENSERNICLI